MRNAEVIRQWQILREVESARTGVTIHQLARTTGVTTRTIRRDLTALQEAGFALFDEGEGNETMRTWSFFLDGRWLHDLEYPLVGSACETVLSGGFRYYPHGLPERFPGCGVDAIGIELDRGVGRVNAGATASGLLGVARMRRAVGAEKELGVTADRGVDQRLTVLLALEHRHAEVMGPHAA